MATEPVDAQFNYDESKVPKYELPDPLRMADGTRVATPEEWSTKRRPEVLELFAREMFGKAPAPPKVLGMEVIAKDAKALDGAALRKEVRLRLHPNKKDAWLDILLYVPAQAPRPVPFFVGLNFFGNHSIHADSSITLSPRWMRRNDAHIVNHRATEKSRGTAAGRWPLKEIVARGYGVATVYCGDIDPDFHDGFKNGVHGWFRKDGGEARRPDDWGTIAAWAWGLSRVMDYFEKDTDVDHHKVALLGHSRLGKTALWAGALDTRFALVISNNSGCGGAALSRRRFGETVKRINTSFPHWFCDNFKKYNGKEDELPFDQHMLVALIAPRPAYVASAVEDRWADPRGEFLSARGATPVYQLLGKKGIDSKEMPGANRPVGDGSIRYHIRTGKHDVTLYDWERYMDFADQHFGRGKKRE